MDTSIEHDELALLPVANPAAELPRLGKPDFGQVRLGERVAMLIAIIVPFFGLIAAIASFWGWGFRWTDLILLMGMYLFTAIGITVGFHRLFTHRAFETNRLVQFVFALGSMAVQGPLLQWVAIHRRHHQHSDDCDDPHTPHHQGSGVWSVVRGLWHAHLGWMFVTKPSDLQQYVKDLRQSKLLRAVSVLFPVWVAAGLLQGFRSVPRTPFTDRHQTAG